MLEFLVGNDLLSAVLAFAVILIPAVIVHKLGHFLAAKAVGITVLEFGIGFPPRLAKLFTWQETEFTLNMIPLGGFVRPLGEDMIRPVGDEKTERDREKFVSARAEHAHAEPGKDGEEPSEREELAARGIYNTRAVNEVKPLPRIFFMAAGAIANFIFAFAIFLMIGLIGLPEEVGARVGIAEVEADSPLVQVGLQPGDLIEGINGQFFGNAQEFFALVEQNVGQPVTLHVRRTATTPVQEFTLEFVPTPEVVAYFRSAEPYVLVTAVDEEGPAYEAGLLPGDLITQFNGEPLTAGANPAETLVMLTNQFAGREVILTILRGEEVLEVNVVPRADPPPGRGRIGIGISPQFISPDQGFGYVQGPHVVNIPQPLGRSLEFSTDRMVSIFRLIAEFPSRLLGGDTPPEERRVVSVVGISQLGGAILQDSIVGNQITPFLEYIALISIALGFTNLLPIPALDGGRILFVVLEIIRGKPIPPEREGIVHLAGIIFILSLGVFVIINDLINPLTDILP